MIPLSSRVPKPMWGQVEDALVRLLELGAFSPGELLPPPGDLAWRMAVSPTAVREAYRALVRRGLVRLTPAGEAEVLEQKEGGPA